MGDDLGDDDYYLPPSSFRADIDESSFADSSVPPSASSSSSTKNSKRKGASLLSSDDLQPSEDSSTSKKAKPAKSQSNAQLLLSASHTLSTSDVSLQSAYVSALLASCFPSSSSSSSSASLLLLPPDFFFQCPTPFLSVLPERRDDNLVSFLKASVFGPNFPGGGGMKQLKRYVAQPQPQQTAVPLSGKGAASSASSKKTGSLAANAASSSSSSSSSVLLSPLLLVVTSGALRACELAKSVSGLHCRVGKLFSKNMSITEQVSMLQSGSPPIIIGTPNRLRKIFYKEGGGNGGMKVGDGGINLAAVRMVLIDMKPDDKGFTVLTLNDTKKDLLELLTEQQALFKGAGGAKIALY